MYASPVRRLQPLHNRNLQSRIIPHRESLCICNVEWGVSTFPRDENSSAHSTNFSLRPKRYGALKWSEAEETKVEYGRVV